MDVLGYGLAGRKVATVKARGNRSLTVAALNLALECSAVMSLTVAFMSVMSKPLVSMFIVEAAAKRVLAGIQNWIEKHPRSSGAR